MIERMGQVWKGFNTGWLAIGGAPPTRPIGVGEGGVKHPHLHYGLVTIFSTA